MRVSRFSRVAVCLLPILMAPGVAHAIAVTIQINGTTVSSANCTTSGNTTTCSIAGTYGNVEVSDYPTGSPAQVIAVDDISLPLLKLVNSKFRATANATNGSVTFSATPSQGNNGPKMQRTASGWLVRVENSTAPYTSPTNKGQFIVDGVVISGSNSESIDGIYPGGDTAGSSKTVLSSPWAYGEIKATNFTKSETMGSLNGTRTLKGEFTFYLPLANDYLRLTEVAVVTQNAGGDTDPASVGYTDMWDGDTGRCKCKDKKDCFDRLCPGPDCPIADGNPAKEFKQGKEKKKGEHK